jgi:hypothetical protein
MQKTEAQREIEDRKSMEASQVRVKWTWLVRENNECN